MPIQPSGRTAAQRRLDISDRTADVARKAARHPRGSTIPEERPLTSGHSRPSWSTLVGRSRASDASQGDRAAGHLPGTAASGSVLKWRGEHCSSPFTHTRILCGAHDQPLS